VETRQINDNVLTLYLPQKQKTKIILILILAFVVRLAGIASRPIWYDEAFSILLSEQGPSAILSGTLARDVDSSAAEEHPPAYYFALWGWMRLFGNSLVAVRALSICASLGVVFCVYLIAKKLYNQPTALVAALLSAVLPFQVHYGQEIRMYVFMTFWLCLATYAFLKRQWILFSVAAALAQYTHNLAAFYLIPLALTPVFQRDWKTLRALTVAGFAAILIYSPWLMQLPAQLSKVTTNFWIERPGVEKLFTLLLVYLPHLPLPNGALLPALALATLTVALAAFQTYRAKTASGFWLAYLSFAPPLLLWLVSQFSPMYVERALLPSHALFCVWLSWAFTQTKLPRPIQWLAFALIFVSAGIGLYQHVVYKGFPYIESASINENVRGRLQEGDAIVHSNKLSYLPSFYFDRALRVRETYIADPRGSGSDTLSPATRKILGLNVYENIESASANATRVWFVIYQRSIDEYKSQGHATHPHLAYLNKYFTLESVATWNDIQVYVYRRSSP